MSLDRQVKRCEEYKPGEITKFIALCQGENTFRKIIARKLNEVGYKTKTGKEWTVQSLDKFVEEKEQTDVSWIEFRGKRLNGRKKV